MEYKSLLLDFANRTKANLEYIKESVAKGSDVYETTQLVNSCLGMLIFPQQSFYEAIPEIPLTDLETDEGISIDFVIDNPDSSHLKGLIRFMRNAIAHHNIEFLASDGELSGLRLWNIRGDTKNWEIEIDNASLEALLDVILIILRNKCVSESMMDFMKKTKLKEDPILRKKIKYFDEKDLVVNFLESQNVTINPDKLSLQGDTSDSPDGWYKHGLKCLGLEVTQIKSQIVEDYIIKSQQFLKVQREKVNSGAIDWKEMPSSGFDVRIFDPIFEPDVIKEDIQSTINIKGEKLKGWVKNPYPYYHKILIIYIGIMGHLEFEGVTNPIWIDPHPYEDDTFQSCGFDLVFLYYGYVPNEGYVFKSLNLSKSWVAKLKLRLLGGVS